MKTVHLPDIDLAVADEGSGPPLVLLHAFPVTHAVWQPLLAALATGRRVIAPDTNIHSPPRCDSVCQHIANLSPLLIFCIRK